MEKWKLGLYTAYRRLVMLGPVRLVRSLKWNMKSKLGLRTGSVAIAKKSLRSRIVKTKYCD